MLEFHSDLSTEVECRRGDDGPISTSINRIAEKALALQVVMKA